MNITNTPNPAEHVALELETELLKLIDDPENVSNDLLGFVLYKLTRIQNRIGELENGCNTTFPSNE